MSELQARLQSSLGSQYRLERELGGGGMSRVFLAEEVALGRKVVIKVLPPEMVSGVNQDRFRREIQLAARLNHPHIVPLLAAGAADDVLWYAMPFIEGESLRVKLARGGELPVAETARILREVADALAYAHGQGVVHRDIKPDNVLLSGRHALVTDFGVAKAVSVSSGDHSMTSLGVALGTPAYMAPEQASADPNVDARADIYALGAMAYEMLVGQPPFSGISAQAILASHITQTPVAVSSHRPAVPPALNAIVMRCLEKRPADRWQSADDIMPHLDALMTPTHGTAPTAAVHLTSSGTAAALRKTNPIRVAVLFGVGSLIVLAAVNLLMNKMGLPGWVMYAAAALLLIGFPIMLATSVRERKRILARTTGTALPSVESGIGGMLTWKKALTGGGLAFGGLAVGAAVFMALRAAGVGPFATLLTAGVLKARDPIVMADFDNRTSDSTLAQSVSEALRIDLTRSPLVKLMEAGDVAGALRRMQKAPGTRVTGDVAREVAERAGAAAVVTGEISPLGAGYVLSVRLLGAKDGATLLAERETANDANGLIPAVDRLSRKLREGIGESLRSIRGGQPLEQVTTASIDALRKYSEANTVFERGEFLAAADLLNQAVRLDSNFAMAHRKLAVIYTNTQTDNTKLVAEARKAFELRDRLPEVERLLATAYFYSNVQYNSDKVIEAYRQILDTWPDETTARNNLAIELNTRFRFAEAEEIALAGVRSSPTTGTLWVNALEALVYQSKWSQVDSVLAEWGKMAPQNGQRMAASARYTAARGNFELALVRSDSLTKSPDLLWRNRSMNQHAVYTRVMGQLARSEQYSRDLIKAARDAQVPDVALRTALDYARLPAVYRNRPAETLRRTDSVLRLMPMDSLPALNRPYLQLSDVYVDAGDIGKAEKTLAEYERVVPAEQRAGDYQFLSSRARVEWAKKDYAKAQTDLREYRSKWGGNLSGIYQMARVFDDMGQADSAIANYEYYATAGDGDPYERTWYLPATYRRLGALYAEKNNKDKALEYYGKLTSLWKNADPELQPVLADVKQRMSALTAEPRKP